MMYINHAWRQDQDRQIDEMRRQGGFGREYTRLMARSKYHPPSRSARHYWRRICRIAAQTASKTVELQTRFDGLDRS